MSRSTCAKSNSSSAIVIGGETNVRSQRVSAISTSRCSSGSGTIVDNDVSVCGRNSTSSQYVVTNHNHEFSATTSYENDDQCQTHNHSINGTTGPAIKSGNSHVHQIQSYTDTFNDHFHDICETTGPAIYLANGKHIHRVKGETSLDVQHSHDYYFVTQVQDPTDVPDQNIC